MKFRIRGGDLKAIADGAQSIDVDEGVWKFRDNRWLMKCADPGGNGMFASLVTESNMEEYERGGTEQIAVNLDELSSFIGSKSSTVGVKTTQNSAGTNQIELSQGEFNAYLGLINPEMVEGRLDSTPQVDYSCVVKGDIGFIFDFFTKVDSVVNSDSYYISAREEGVYLYSQYDNNEIDMLREWDEFDDYNYNLHKANNADREDETPQEKGGVDSIFSLDYSKSFNKISDKGAIYFDNHMTIKIVFETEKGVKCSYILAPRLPEETDSFKAPARIME